MRIDKWGCALYWERIQWLKLQLLIACNRIKLHVFVFLPSSALWICWSIFKPKWMLHATVDSCKLQIRTVPSDHFSSHWWLWVLTEVTSTHLTQHQQPGTERWKKLSLLSLYQIFLYFFLLYFLIYFLFLDLLNDFALTVFPFAMSQFPFLFSSHLV